MDLLYLFKVLAKKKWIILFSVIFGLVAGFGFSLLKKNKYMSYAQYTTGLSQTQKVSLQLSEVFDINQVDFRFNTVIETFKSPTVLGMLGYDLLLHDLDSPHPFRNLSASDKKDTAYTNINFDRAKQVLNDKLAHLQLLSNYNPTEKKISDLLALYKYDAIALSKDLVIERLQQTDFLNIFYSSENNELSAYVTNTIGRKFIEFYTSLTTYRTKESLYKLDSLAVSKRKDVEAMRKRLQDFRAKIGTPNPGDAATAAMTGLQQLESELTQQQTKKNDLTSQLSAVNTQLANLVPSTAGTQTEENSSNNNVEILALKNRNESLNRQLAAHGGNDPDIEAKILANNNRIIALNKNSPPSSSTGISAAQKAADKKDDLLKKKIEIEAELQSTEVNIDLYKRRVEEFTHKAYSGGGEEVLANGYESDLQTAEKELEKYNNSLFASQDLDVSPDFNFRQTLIGQPAIKPEPAHRSIITGVTGLALGVMAVLAIVIAEFMDSSLRTPSIFQKESKLKLLTAVSHVDLEKKTLKDVFNIENEQRPHVEEVFVENMRKLRFELESSGKKIILFTSNKSGEGKSTILEALAHTLSLSKKKVLLIDTNFSHNTLTSTFSAKPTLENFSLNGQDSATDKIWGITTLTNISNTDIIGCNEGNFTPSEILPKNNLLSNLHKVAPHYDFILMEGAALNAHADSKELAKYAEGIVIVYSAENQLGEIDRTSVAFLKSTGNKFLGTVLNNVDEDFLDL